MWKRSRKAEPGVDAPGLSKITAVIFSVPDKRLAAMDVATGPCVPLPGRKTSLATVHQQEGYETPEVTAYLYTVLTGLPANDVLVLIDEKAEGRLYRFADHFLAAMADASRHEVALIQADEAERGKLKNDDPPGPFELQRAEWDRAWLSGAPWHSEMVGTGNRLFRLGKARAAHEKGQALHVWYGPRVPEYVVTMGTGPYPGRS